VWQKGSPQSFLLFSQQSFEIFEILQLYLLKSFTFIWQGKYDFVKKTMKL